MFDEMSVSGEMSVNEMSVHGRISITDDMTRRQSDDFMAHSAIVALYICSLGKHHIIDSLLQKNSFR